MRRAAEVRRALADDIVIGSAGPVMNTALADCGPDVAPVYPKMAALVSEAVEMGRSVLARKRGTQKGGETCGAATLSKR